MPKPRLCILVPDRVHANPVRLDKAGLVRKAEQASRMRRLAPVLEFWLRRSSQRAQNKIRGGGN